MDYLLHPIMAPITFPLVAGVLCLVLPRAMARDRGLIATAATILTLLLVWPLFKAGYAVEEFHGFLSLRVDGLSGLVLLATAVFGVLICVYSIGFMRGKGREREYYTYLLWTLGCSFGAILANDLVLLLVFWGLLGFTLYLMIGLSGPDASAAAKKSFIIIGGSDSVLLLGVVIVWYLTGSTRMDETPLALKGITAHVAFLAFVAAALAKAGAMPLHTWVPDCGEKAYPPVTAFLPASLDKLLGIYLLARVVVHLFATTPLMNSLLMLVGALTVILAVMMALVQHDMKRLLSYHAVSQVGYMVLGIGSGNPLGIAGGLFHMLNHAMYKSCLFLSAGAVEYRAGTSDLDRLGGLGRAMPATFVAFIVAALSISGLPPLNGFASKWMVYQGIITSGQSGGFWTIWLAAAMLGSALTLASFVKVAHAAFLRRPPAHLEIGRIREVGPSMWLPMLTLAGACVLFGVAAYHLPLQYLVLPAVGQKVYYPGIWWAGPATAMLLAGIVLGFLFYLVTSARRVRVCETYIGGEHMGETYVRGEAPGPGRDVEVTGVDFYRTVQDMGFLKTAYRLAEKKCFDIYNVGIAVVFYFVESLRKAHTGMLPLYLTWVVFGLLAIMYLLMKSWG